MNNIKVRTKLVIVMVIALIALALCTVISNTSLSGLGNNALDIIENDMRSSYDEQIKAQVDNVISLCQSIYNRYEKGEYTLDEAEKLAADQIRDLRYGNNGYFWVDTYDGTNVVLLGNDTEGTNRMDAVDTNGFAYMQAIINAGKQEDGGFTDYVFPREGETESSPKRAYSKAFEPFGWVLGTGNYTDDIDDDVLDVKNEFSSYESNSRMAIIGIAVVMEVILILVLTLITASIVKPLKKSLTHIDEIAQGDFSKEFEQDLLKRKDDFGQLADSLEKMRSEMKELIGEVKSEALEITGMVQEIDTSIRALDDQIENVSATTEELAAGMEETAASSEEINAMSHEIESAAKSIAERSQDGANEADEIRERAVKIKKDTDENDRRTRSIHEEINESLTKALEDIKVVDQINVLAKSIMDITGQTNLLALNASIEAARAGEAGKGFAVVADEIRVLAEQSKAAVAHIQEVTGNVTAAVENLANDAERLLEFVGNDVVESLGGFAEMANSYNSDAANVDSLVTDFSASSEQLLASINGVMDAISDVSKTATEGATGTTDIAEKVGNVVQEAEAIKQKAETTYHSAEKLQKNVERFIV
ncbi:methyl-accepting chemotaxis protein [Roseburia inulinivorans]|uniref:methyl-accepting chemotaxis protein n=1 Tax=Roseburia inulinivorans TaxID=360807 RepID=UPI002490F05A|nr:methyl-accepting chemotaxis protein [Roseburia inulinivorans]